MQHSALNRGGDLREHLESLRQSAVKAVENVSADEVRFAPEAVVEDVIAQHSVDEVAFDFDGLQRKEIYEETEAVTHWGETAYIRVQVLPVVVPMTGDKELLRRRASTYSMSGGPRATLRDGAIEFNVVGQQLTAQAVQGQVEALKVQLGQLADCANNDVKVWSGTLRASVNTAVMNRKKRLDDIAALDASLDIPLVSTAKSQQVTVPVARKRVVLTTFASGKQAARLEPAISEAVYEDVVKTLSSLGRAFERPRQQ